MVKPAQSAETWQVLIELRCRREIIERWLASQSLSVGLRHSIQAMLHECEDQLQSLTRALSR